MEEENRRRIREVFTHKYGYLLLDNASDGEGEEEVTQTAHDLYLEYRPTGKNYNGWPEYIIRGCYTDVRNFVEMFWADEDPDETTELMMGFEYDR